MDQETLATMPFFAQKLMNPDNILNSNRFAQMQRLISVLAVHTKLRVSFM